MAGVRLGRSCPCCICDQSASVPATVVLTIVMNIDVLPTAWLTMWRSVPIDETLVGHGYDGHKLPWDAFWGMRYAVVHDPDGDGVDLFSPLPSA
jgi:hypothetical protein